MVKLTSRPLQLFVRIGAEALLGFALATGAISAFVLAITVGTLIADR